jgi:preprotein translocase subunit SecE
MSEARKKELAKPTFTDNAVTYLKGVRSEWGKITWPDKKQVGVEVVIVIGIVLFFTMLVYLYDLIFTSLFRLIPGG